ncbi:MAG: hypothetical protein U9R03_03270 [Candidatus Aerophobetes bacterium]|nr:hypothetical protein [Candidatus Aerophobetes bacterium]
MKIDKRKLLKTIITQDLRKKMSPEEIRVYLLLVISVDQANGMGKISREYLERHLGHSLYNEQLEKMAHTFRRLHFAKIDYSPEKSEIEFRLFKQ